MKHAPDSIFHESLLKSGWTQEEVNRLYSYSEEYNPELSEEYALRKMRELRIAVEARISGGPRNDPQ